MIRAKAATDAQTMTVMAGPAATGTALTGRGTGTGTGSGNIAAPAVTETAVTSDAAVKVQSQAGDFLSMHQL